MMHNDESETMHKIPFITDLACITEKTVHPINSDLVNNQQHRSISYKRRNIIV